STTGNIKMARHLLVLKNVREIFKKLIHPHAVIQIKLNERILDWNVNVSILSFVILYLFTFLVSSIIVALNGFDILTSVSAVASSMGNIGPGFGSIGPAFNYSHFPEFCKIFLSFLMIAGRLELLTVLLIFVPEFWKK
ncbi:MAG TPA: potassium transporter TrkG, partial [Bacteroidales bacterium]|nr:potassium transporter TrkG [Bacteroidales bacterium]